MDWTGSASREPEYSCNYLSGPQCTHSLSKVKNYLRFCNKAGTIIETINIKYLGSSLQRRNSMELLTYLKWNEKKKNTDYQLLQEMKHFWNPWNPGGESHPFPEGYKLQERSNTPLQGSAHSRPEGFVWGTSWSPELGIQREITNFHERKLFFNGFNFRRASKNQSKSLRRKGESPIISGKSSGVCTEHKVPNTYMKSSFLVSKRPISHLCIPFNAALIQKKGVQNYWYTTFCV